MNNHNLVESVARAMYPEVFIGEPKLDATDYIRQFEQNRARSKASAAVVAVLKGIRDEPLPVQGGTFAQMALEETLSALLAQIEGGSDETK